MKEMRIAECVFDLTMIAHEIINDCDCATDIDSRDLFFEIVRLAEEFEKNYDEENDDYMTKIEEYGVNKLRRYLGVSQCYETIVELMLACREMTSDPDGVSFDHEKRIRRMASENGYYVVKYKSATKEVE